VTNPNFFRELYGELFALMSGAVRPIFSER
jgi:hypothetical protein